MGDVMDLTLMHINKGKALNQNAGSPREVQNGLSLLKHDYYHLYADDTQLYISFNNDCCADLDEAKLRVERCVEEIDLWMCKNLLKLNQDKTELVVMISSKYRNTPNLKQ